MALSWSELQWTLGTLGMKHEYTTHGTPVQHRAPCTHTHNSHTPSHLWQFIMASQTSGNCVFVFLGTLAMWDGNATRCTTSDHRATLLLEGCKCLMHKIPLCNLQCIHTYTSSPDQYILRYFWLFVCLPCHLVAFLWPMKRLMPVLSHIFFPPVESHRGLIPKCMSKKIPLHITASIFCTMNAIWPW